MSSFLSKAILFNLVSSIASFFLLFANVIVLTRYLGVEGFYVYTIYFTFVGAFSIVNFSFQHIFVNFEYIKENFIILSFLSILQSILCYIVVFSSSSWIENWFGIVENDISIILFFLVLVRSFNDMFLSFFISKDLIKVQNMIKIVNSVVIFVLTLVLVELNFRNEVIYLPFLLSNLICVLISFYFYNPFKLTATKGSYYLYFRELLGFLISGTSSYAAGFFANYSLILFLSPSWGPTLTSYFQLAFTNISRAYNLIGSFLSPNIYPFLKLNKNNPRVITFLIFLFCAVIVPIFLLLFVFANELIKFFYGSDWIDAAFPWRIFCIIFVFRCISVFSMNIFHIQNKPSLVTYTSIFRSMVYCAVIMFDFVASASFGHSLIFLAIFESMVLLCVANLGFIISQLKFINMQLKIFLATVLTFIQVNLFEVFINDFLQVENVLGFLILFGVTYISTVLSFLFFTMGINCIDEIRTFFFPRKTRYR